MTTPLHFSDLVLQAFRFLEEDYSFRASSHDAGSTRNSVHYEKSALYVDVGWYKGEVDVRVGVTVDTSILRPYRPKGFDLWRIARYMDPRALDDRPPLPRYAQSVAESGAYIRYYADLLKTHCGEILGGDLKPLEEMMLEDLTENSA